MKLQAATIHRLQALHAGLAKLKPEFIMRVLQADESVIKGGFTFGQWMITKNEDVHFLLTCFEEEGEYQMAKDWLDDALIESGRFEKTSPKCYVTYKVR